MLLPRDDRFSYIIGNNGAGKSMSLAEDAIVRSKEFPVVVIASGPSDRFTYGRGTKYTSLGGSYTYLGNRTVGNALHINTLSSNSVIYYAKLIANQRHTIFQDFLKKIGFEPVVHIRGLKKKRSADGYGGFDSTMFNEEFYFKNSQLFDDKSKSFDIQFSKEKGPVPLGALSSGEQTIISVALKLLSELAPNTVFYIDEPELSLHVEWQSQWPELFHGLISPINDCKLRVATHSPIIISRALELGADCYSLQKNTLAKIEEKNLNVERIIFNEFHTYTPDNKYIYTEFSRILGELVNKLNSNENASANEFAKVELENITAKIEGSVAEEKDRLFLKQSLDDFSRAVQDVLHANAT